jgi:hypothetical protein
MNEPIKATVLESNALSGVAWEAVKRSAVDSSQALVAILFGCACVESVLNHVLYELRTVPSEHLPNGYDRVSTLAREAGVQDDRLPWDRKVRVLALGATGQPVDLGRTPFQEFSLLVALRNWIVHLQPEQVVVRYDDDERPTRLVADEPHKLVQELIRRKVIDPIASPAGPSLVGAVRSAAVAQWSYGVVYNVLETIASWFPAWKQLLIAGHPRPKPEWSLANKPLQPTSGPPSGS